MMLPGDIIVDNDQITIFGQVVRRPKWLSIGDWLRIWRDHLRLDKTWSNNFGERQ